MSPRFVQYCQSVVIILVYDRHERSMGRLLPLCATETVATTITFRRTPAPGPFVFRCCCKNLEFTGEPANRSLKSGMHISATLRYADPSATRL